MVRDAEAHADEDKKRRETIEARNQLDSLVYQTEKSLGGARRQRRRATKAQLESAHRATRRRRWRTRDADAERCAAPKRPQQGVAQAGGGDVREGRAVAGRRLGRRRSASAGGARRRRPHKDDVVDADFEEVKG